MPQRPFRNNLIRILCVSALVAAQVACSDPVGLEATEETQTSTVSLYALTGTPPGFPSALSVPANQSSIVDAALLFDVVFDLDAQQRAVLYPMKLIAWPRIDIHKVGMLKSAETYDELTHAPLSGYNYDDAQIVSVGDVIVVESNDSRVCDFPFPSRLYAKLVIDEINLSERVLRMRMTQNPNCGFRSFLAGIPTD